MQKDAIEVRDMERHIEHVLLKVKNACTREERQQAARMVMMTYSCLGLEEPDDHTIALGQQLVEALNTLVK